MSGTIIKTKYVRKNNQKEIRQEQQSKRNKSGTTSKTKYVRYNKQTKDEIRQELGSIDNFDGLISLLFVCDSCVRVFLPVLVSIKFGMTTTPTGWICIHKHPTRVDFRDLFQPEPTDRIVISK